MNYQTKKNKNNNLSKKFDMALLRKEASEILPKANIVPTFKLRQIARVKIGDVIGDFGLLARAI